MSNEQSVAEQPDAQAKPVAEDASAQDMDSLLAEYKPEEPKDTPEEPKVDVNAELLKEMKFLKEEREKTAMEGAAKAFDTTVKTIKGDLSIPDKFVKAYINQEALDRPGLKEAYLDRERNPQKWEKIQTALSKELRDVVSSLPSKDATAIANQVESAVRNAQPQTPNNNVPDTKTINTMSDKDFDDLVKNAAKQYG